ncbi:PAS domain-containing sensor histidine kinase [Larkinella soli]|uniref:PAS domain-containing sensor histidine kinase n=1 Tax=Larkinella soli TaxID=1770527 RepID=UPI000FFCAB00|nr:PAS domain-containing sensor histidine kinase [Larkinella soli]
MSAEMQSPDAFRAASTPDPSSLPSAIPVGAGDSFSLNDYKILLDSFAGAVWETNAEGWVVVDSPSWRSFTGQTVEQWLNQKWVDAFHPDDRDFALRLWRDSIEKRISVDTEVRVRRAGSDWHWTNVRATPVYNPDGSVAKWVGVTIDITEKKRAEEALRQSEERFRVMTNAVPLILWQTDLEGHADFFNKQWTDYTGAEFTSTTAKVISDTFVHPDDAEPTMRAFAEAQRTGKTFEIEHRIRSASGEYRWFLVRAEPYRDLNTGEILRWLGSSVDIHERKLAEEALRQSEALLQKAFSTETVGVLFFRLNGGITGANDTFLRMCGYSREELLREIHWERLTAPECMDITLRSARQIEETGETPPYEKQMIRRDGSRWWGLFAPTRISGTGKESECVEFILDITERKLAENALRESEERFRSLSARLDEQVRERTQELEIIVQDLKRSNDSLAQFAYVASHDLQEPLRKIQQFGTLLESQYAEQPGPGADYLGRMLNAAGRMSVLIRDLLTYSRIATRQDAGGQVVLQKVVDIVLNDLELAIEETGATIDVGPLPMVRGNASQLGQLFLNLINNALKFRQAGTAPVITIRSEEVSAKDLPQSVRPARQAAAYYRIGVADNGIGFDEQYLERIFQLFQRLHGKSQYLGTGIGLAICQKVAANHGGAITARSRSGHGATFYVYLPVYTGAAGPDV